MKGKLGEFDFERTAFTLLDHRRLSNLLMHFFPNDYTLGTPDALHHDIKEFFRRVYALNDDQYVRCYLILDIISGRTWWADIKQRYRGQEHENYFRIREEIG